MTTCEEFNASLSFEPEVSRRKAEFVCRAGAVPARQMVLAA